MLYHTPTNSKQLNTCLAMSQTRGAKIHTPRQRGLGLAWLDRAQSWLGLTAPSLGLACPRPVLAWLDLAFLLLVQAIN